MRKFLLAASVVPLLTGSAPALADGHMVTCDDGWTTLNESYATIEAEEIGVSGARNDYSTLRRAAMILQTAGYGDACESVVEAIKDLADNPEARQQFAERRVAMSEQLAMANTDLAERRRDKVFQAEMDKAVSLSEYPGSLTAERLIGAEVVNTNGEDIGEVDDVLMSAGSGMTHLLVGFGGFLGLGDKDVAVPIKGAMIAPGADTIYVSMTEAQMEAAPDFDYESYEGDTEAWREANDAAYEMPQAN